MEKGAKARHDASFDKHVERIASAREKRQQSTASRREQPVKRTRTGAKPSGAGENRTLEESQGREVPKAQDKWLLIWLGLLNLCFFGWGTILSGVIRGSKSEVLTGVLQFVPFVGWTWSIVWGLLMIAAGVTTTDVPSQANPHPSPPVSRTPPPPP